MSNCVQITWTPDGVRVSHERGSAMYANIEQALAGARLLLESLEETYCYPPRKYPTADHIQAENLARAIEDAIERGP